MTTTTKKNTPSLPSSRMAQVSPQGDDGAGTAIMEGGQAAAAKERAMIAAATGIVLSTQGGGMQQFGSTSGGLIYDEGTKMLDSGRKVALASRDAWDELPTLNQASVAHSALIATEGRKDYTDISLANLIVDDRGMLTRANGGLRFSRWSWGQLRSHAPADAVVANNLNSWLPGSDYVGTFRTRFPNTDTKTREMFAMVSDKYAVLDGHEVLEMAAATLPAETRARVEYDADTTLLKLDATLHNSYELEDDIVVGRLHRIGLRGSTKDNGGQSHRWQLFAERIACINCTIIPFTIAGIERAHVGDFMQIRHDIQQLLDQAERVMGVFSEHWKAAHVTRVFAGATVAESAADIFERLIRGGWITVKGVKDSELIASLVDAWSDEPGNTYQAINRAITLAAHKFQWPQDGQQALEEQAGIILFQRQEVMADLKLNLLA